MMSLNVSTGLGLDYFQIIKEAFPKATVRPWNDCEILSILCPFCAQEKGATYRKYKLGIIKNLEGRVWATCLRCGYRCSNFFKILQDLNIRVSLSNQQKYHTLQFKAQGKPLIHYNLSTQAELHHFGLIPLQQSAIGMEYFKSRGFSEHDCTHQLFFGSANAADRRFINHIVFGCYPSGFVGRSILEKRFSTYTQTPGKGMWYLPRPLSSEEEEIILVEGPFDAHRLWRYGWGAVGLLGKRIPPRINEFLKQNHIREVRLWLDPDARDDAFQLIQKITRPYRAVIEFEKEPDDCTEEEVDCVIKNSEVYSFEQYHRHLIQKLDQRERSLQT